MWEGRVVSLHSCAAKSEPLGTKDQLVCIAGVGIEGDRYALGTGSYSAKPEVGRQITLIENETLQALARDWDITLKPEDTRRNVVTEGAPLNHLVGRQFRIGDDVVLEDQSDFIDGADDRDLAIRVLCRHRITVVVETDQ